MKLQNLDGSKADTQNINNVYPFNREDDKALQQIEEGLLPPNSGHEEFQVGQCYVYDLSEGNDIDFRIIKVVEVVDEDNVVAQYLAAYPSKMHFSKRPHFPMYRDKSGTEVYTNEPRPHLIGGETTVLVNRSEIRFPPFALTHKNTVPDRIVKKLTSDGYIAIIVDYLESPGTTVNATTLPIQVGTLSDRQAQNILGMALLAGVQHMKNSKRADIKPEGDAFVRSVDLHW